MYDVVALGELLIDFTPQKMAEGKDSYFQKNPGGAPANVLAALSKQGRKTAFIGKVGRDSFGEYLAGILRNNGISTEGMVFSETENTTLAFVELNDRGDRTFTFYRKPGADMMLKPEEVDLGLIGSAKMFHFGSISLTDEPSRAATLRALDHAKNRGLAISYDPNLRLPLWPEADTAKRTILSVFPYADILKISEEELAFLIGTEDLEEGTRQIAETYGTTLIFVTRGERGCYYRAGSVTGSVPAFRVETVDTTGAGDAFLGGVLGRILEEDIPLKLLGPDKLEAIAAFGNAMGSLATTRRGGIPSIPERAEVEALLKGKIPI
ncbi:PfkB family carbohydrate kinase [Cohnella candidum]|uniref:Carbohydrate kinase n=1 Tax=Cohnella candidum TaxID=2674991 RepID=A0A3G3K4X3_9BACL|nr:PfkB family carbohydrate kinase [Cohnella candidum]AYQ75221.1 carbohydrate kinase [Cohnella candidum]